MVATASAGRRWTEPVQLSPRRRPRWPRGMVPPGVRKSAGSRRGSGSPQTCRAAEPRQTTALERNASAGQAGLAPLQISLASQTPAAPRQMRPAGTTRSAGQVAVAPVQVSTTSHRPLEPRHTVLLGDRVSAGQAAAEPCRSRADRQEPFECGRSWRTRPASAGQALRSGAALGDIETPSEERHTVAWDEASAGRPWRCRCRSRRCADAPGRGNCVHVTACSADRGPRAGRAIAGTPPAVGVAATPRCSPPAAVAGSRRLRRWRRRRALSSFAGTRSTSTAVPVRLRSSREDVLAFGAA